MTRTFPPIHRDLSFWAALLVGFSGALVYTETVPSHSHLSLFLVSIVMALVGGLLWIVSPFPDRL